MKYILALCLFSFLCHSNEYIFDNSFEAPLYWSNPASWQSNSVPINGEAVEIPFGKTIILDINSANLASLAINGTLVFAESDLTLTSDWIDLTGTLQIGSPTNPFTHNAIINLTGSNTNGNSLSRGLIVNGGNLELYGQTPASTWNKINGHINPNSTQITILDAQDWHSGDKIIIAPSDYYGVAETQEYEIASLTNNSLNLTSPVFDFHWGLLQYVSNSGMSLTDVDRVIPPDNTVYTPTILDERAEVANISRHIVIQSPDDSLWQNEGFGAHVMVMNLSSVVHIDGVEFNRVGQAGQLGRYPMHWHRLSYDGFGNEIGDVSNHFVQNSSIHHSKNRCITIHGTNGVKLLNNSCFDILGHAIYLEDAVERRNIIDGNLVLKVRFPAVADALKLHDVSEQWGLETGASGMWASNPDNTVTNNTFADAEGFGLWMAFPAQPVGPNANVPILPYRMALGNYDNNTMHSNGLRGVMLDNAEIDNIGTVQSIQYRPTSDGLDNWENVQNFTISGWKLWKNKSSNFWDRVFWPTFESFVSADSVGKFFSGSGDKGLINHTLFVGTSLNNLSPNPNAWMGPATAFATYHSGFSATNNIIVEFPLVDGKTSGVFASDDYYLRPVEKGHFRNFNNLLINSHPGYRSDAKVDEAIGFNFAQGFTHYVFASALWDPYGIWGDAGNWSVYDLPFLTHNANCTTILPLSQHASSCDGEYFGVTNFILDQNNLPWDGMMELNINRYDDNTGNSVVGQWVVDEAQSSWLLHSMRHFATHENGIYLLDFPLASMPQDVAVTVENMFTASQSFTLGIRYDGTKTAQVFSSTYDFYHYNSDTHAQMPADAYKHDYPQVANRQAVIDASGEVFWQDSVNNIVWIKVSYADLQQYTPIDFADFYSNEALYNAFHLRVWSTD